MQYSGIRTRRADFVCRLIEESKMPRNQIAAIAGLTNTYICDLEKANIVNVNRKKLLRLAVALNLNLNRIEDLLRLFDRAGLSREDIPTFIASARKRRATTALFPLRDFYAYELAVYAMECIPGDQVLVNDRPTVCLREAGHRTFSDSHLVAAHPLYGELLETIGRVRREQFEANLAAFKIVHYICRQCLEDYVSYNDDKEEAFWRRKHVANLLRYHRRYPNLEVYLTGVCSYMLFSIKEPDNGAEVQFNFCAKPGHYVPGDRPGRLAGFSTTNPVLLQSLRDELASIRTWILPEFEDRGALQDYLSRLVNP